MEHISQHLLIFYLSNQMRYDKHNKFKISDKLQQIGHRFFNDHIDMIATLLEKLHFFMVELNKVDILVVSGDGEGWYFANVGTDLLLIAYYEMLRNEVGNMGTEIGRFLSKNDYSAWVILNCDLGYVVLEHP